jgi:hypothetical protein
MVDGVLDGLLDGSVDGVLDGSGIGISTGRGIHQQMANFVCFGTKLKLIIRRLGPFQCLLHDILNRSQNGDGDIRSSTMINQSAVYIVNMLLLIV